MGFQGKRRSDIQTCPSICYGQGFEQNLDKAMQCSEELSPSFYWGNVSKFGPWQTVYHYFRKRRDEGVFEQLSALLVGEAGGGAAGGQSRAWASGQGLRARGAEMGRGAHFRLDGELQEADDRLRVPLRLDRGDDIPCELLHRPEQGSQTHSLNKFKTAS